MPAINPQIVHGVDSVRNAIAIVNEYHFQSAGFPIIGSGSGNRSVDRALGFMLEEFARIESDATVTVVRHEKVQRRICAVFLIDLNTKNSSD